jgi:putative redox protein
MKGTIRWIDGMKFSGEIGGNTVEMEKGHLAPMQMLLLSVVSCTAFDVIYALKKFREPVEGLETTIVGERRDEHPKYFTKMTLTYIAKGDLDEKKVERAIRLSQDTYCPAMALMKKAGVEVTWTYEIVR